MGISIFKFIEKVNSYGQIKADTQSDDLLGMLLLESQNHVVIGWHLDWLCDENKNHSGINSVWYQKVDADIIITSEFDDQEIPDECVMPKQTFAKLLEGWSEILKQLPPYVVIVHNGAELAITAHDHNPLEQNLQSK